MRDIGNRIDRYRLSRYARPSDPVRRRLRWFWLLAIAWVAWAGFLSNHSAYRLWRLGQETRRTEQELAKTEETLRALQREQDDPAAQRERAERELRRNGMARPGEVVYRIRDVAPDSLHGLP